MLRCPKVAVELKALNEMVGEIISEAADAVVVVVAVVIIVKGTDAAEVVSAVVALIPKKQSA